MTYPLRNTARAIILTSDHEVLLMRMAFPWQKEEVWILPGGGIEEGENVESTVAREIYEETGLTDIEIIGEVWNQDLLIEAANLRLKQRYFLVRAERFDAKPTKQSEPENEWIREFRWWTVNSLVTSEIVVEPKLIAAGIQSLITLGLPAEPLDIDAVS